MKIRKLLSLILVGILCFACLSMVACDGGSNDAGAQTLLMEAEFIDIDDVPGAGISSDQQGLQMIYGEGTQAQKDLGWSNGYYVGYTYNANLTLTFKFNSDEATTAIIVLRLGSEIGNITLDSSNFAVKLNGTSIMTSSLFIENSTMEAMNFQNKTVATNANLVVGENKLELVILSNDLNGAGRTGGPCVDYVKVTANSTLTWEPKTDNPTRRDSIE